jgi:hypothetical protein
MRDVRRHNDRVQSYAFMRDLRRHNDKCRVSDYIDYIDQGESTLTPKGVTLSGKRSLYDRIQ